MSSMRNATQRRNHRERGQPLDRVARLGILEKHKDYSLRSKNHNENKRRLKILRQKAVERNPDEFSYGMLSSQSRSGQKLADRQNSIHGQDVVKLLKTQDAGYVTTMLQKTKRVRTRLEQGFIVDEDRGAKLLDALSSHKKRSHKIFVTSGEEQRHYNADRRFPSWLDATTRAIRNPCTHEGKNESNSESPVYMPEDATKTPRAIEHQELALKQDKLLSKQRRKEQGARKLKLAALNAREKDLMEAKNELDLQRAKMNNSVGGTTRIGTKWRVRERKR